VGTGHENRAYDLVLTSETIYAEDSVDDLVAVLRAATASPSGSDMAAQVQPKHVDIALEDSLGGLKLEAWKKQPLVEGEGVVMVAAKVSWLKPARVSA
jgi:protein-histidine N-methyltransferase